MVELEVMGGVIVVKFIDYLHKHPDIRKKAFIIFSFLASILGITLLYLTYIAPSSFILLKFENTLIVLFIIFIIIVTLLFLTILSYTSIKITAGGIALELNEIKREREDIKKGISHAPEVNIFDTVQLGLNQLTEYYTINKSQARNSFRFSIFAIVLGLITIVGGIWIFYFRDTPNLQLATISSISGTLIESIGGLYFLIYKKSLEQLNYFYDKLTETQNIMLAVKLAESMENEEKKAEVREKIIISLIPVTKK